jgi:hypothetical protein
MNEVYIPGAMVVFTSICVSRDLHFPHATINGVANRLLTPAALRLITASRSGAQLRHYTRIALKGLPYYKASGVLQAMLKFRIERRRGALMSLT